ncbi:PorV/PorQ family protein [Candidatus Aerophobetes bacterium]|uniref:PorV/PorQ family protein n=1 Tax=Aerophobetes bacterium TaxID=2030807 RepID=A0A523QLU1_UNCAE|nr:MAG: PorV/PorQ family protein [Candidatus Aerophobetes bacterium]
MYYIWREESQVAQTSWIADLAVRGIKRCPEARRHGMRKRWMCLGLIIWALVLPSQVHGNGSGTTAASFLKIPVGARAAAMGEAFSAVVDDATSLYWNPAGLVQVKDKEFSAVYNQWFAEIYQGYLGAALSTWRGTVALGVNYVNMGKMEGRDEWGEPSGEFSASDLQVSLGYGNQISPRLDVGLAVGLIESKIADDSESTYSGNLGILFSLSESVSLALVGQNIGSSLGNDSLPFALRGGAAVKSDSLILAADLASPSDGPVYYCAGFEWWLGKTLAFRAGYRSERSIGSGITAGLGFQKGRVRLDYAYVPYDELGTAQRISLHLRF